METMLFTTNTKEKEPDLFRTISLLTLLTGTLDIIAENIHYYLGTDHGGYLKSAGTEEPVSFLTYLTHGGPESVFRSIAYAVFNNGMNEKLLVAWGIVFHFMIAFLFTSSLFLIYRRTINLLKNKFITALIYGFLIWAIMNLVVLPLTNHGKFPADPPNAIISELILTLTIALPVTLRAHRFYVNKRST